MSDRHMSIWGVGPIYFSTILIVTAVVAILNLNGKLPVYEFSVILLPILVGIILIVIGITLWISAVIFSKLVAKIKSNTLVTNGVFAYVRNPIYSAIMFICAGIIFLLNNVLLLVIPLLYWGFLTILLVHTEEKWLLKLYKQEYVEYCKTVNRCIPFFQRKSKLVN